MGKFQTETFPHRPSNSKVLTSRPLGLIFFHKDETLEVNKLFLLYGFLFCFCRPVISLLALLTHNALELANQSVYYIGCKHKPYDKYKKKPLLRLSFCHVKILSRQPISYVCEWLFTDLVKSKLNSCRWIWFNHLYYFKIIPKIRAGLFKARLSLPRTSKNFDFSFVTFWRGILFILFVLQFWAVVIWNYIKWKRWKTFLNKKKRILHLTCNPGLTVTGFWTT